MTDEEKRVEEQKTLAAQRACSVHTDKTDKHWTKGGRETEWRCNNCGMARIDFEGKRG